MMDNYQKSNWFLAGMAFGCFMTFTICWYVWIVAR